MPRLRDKPERRNAGGGREQQSREDEDQPPAPMDVDLYELEGEAKKRIKQTPGSLEEVLDALDADRDFLMRGDVFTDDLIEAWLTLKRQSAKEIALRPHPYEFYLYSDV